MTDLNVQFVAVKRYYGMPKLIDNLSDKEVLLFKKLGFEKDINDYDANYIIWFYRIVCEKCFLENRQGMEVDSLRRCMIAINSRNPYRKTKAFDDLIIIE